MPLSLPSTSLRQKSSSMPGHHVIARSLSEARELAAAASRTVLDFSRDADGAARLNQALRIRAVEEALLELFGRGLLHGTIHSCVGQELIAVAVGAVLREHDFLTSNHRCHGHFIAATSNWRGLIDEVIGNSDGVCAGIGSSQHLYAPNFISNGQQGGLLPVGAGIALDRKERFSGNVVFSFLGEGTLGEGILYETLNLASLWELPQIFVCENNYYSQSTPQSSSVAGRIEKRPEAFGIPTFQADTWNLVHLFEVVAKAADEVRRSGGPAFITVSTYRLNPHSKGDDQRSKAEIAWFVENDPLNVLLAERPDFQTYFETLRKEARDYAEIGLTKPKLDASAYFRDQVPVVVSSTWTDSLKAHNGERLNKQLNEFFARRLATDSRAFFIGEDIADPYGGAFKVSKGFTDQFPKRALTTPISEAAIVGLGAGLALTGNRSCVEIMFGDFITYGFDQIVNNASKFHHMYNHEISCPLIVRAPMGGRRGYGPTHSQSLERFLIGIDNCVTLSLNSLIPVEEQLGALYSLDCPVVLLENKIDYALRTFEAPRGFRVQRSDARFPSIRVTPVDNNANATFVSYGGMARYCAEHLVDIFDATDVLAELIVPTSISPVDFSAIIDSTTRTGKLAIIEEGSATGSVGAEICAQLLGVGACIPMLRISGRGVPVPSAPALEEETLPSLSRICSELNAWLGDK
jgi:2-oxoisovalerate dehydrogenase E1 component